MGTRRTLHCCTLQAAGEMMRLLTAPHLQGFARSLTPAPTAFLSTSAGNFQVTRTASKQLPVYTDMKNGRTKFVTVIRRIRGDVAEFETELAKVCSGAEIHRRHGSI